MGAYIIRRILWGIVLLILVSALTFVLFNVLPAADPAVLRAGRNATPQDIAIIRHQLGLDKPIYTQFYRYMKAIILHFNFGFSYYSGQSVISLIKDRFPATLSLTLGAVVVWMLMGIPVGIISAIKRGTFLDRVAMGGALVFVSMPTFWLGLLLLLLFAKTTGYLHIFPGFASYVPFSQNPGKWFTSLLLPWFVLAATSAAIYSRLLRGSLLETMGEDYIRTARAKGLPERTVIRRHAVRSAITPIVTLIGLDVGTLLAGNAILTETVFNIPGVGRLLYNAINVSDLTTIQGITLFGAFFIVFFNLIVDIGYAYLDPRVRYT